MNNIIAVNVNSVIQTTGGTMVSPVYVGTVSAGLQYVVPPPTATSPPKRRWTGRPKGKTEEQQNENIRKRVSYKWLVDEGRYLRSIGVPVNSLVAVLSYYLQQRIRFRGFSYSSNGYWARQSMDLLSKDLEDYNMVEKLGLK